MALPVYTMNCFKLPKGICDDINRVLARYWWSKNPDKRSMHWVAWNKLSLPKKGGLGFRDIESFNLALLAKQVWRLLQNPGNLAARLLKGRYFAEQNILTASIGYKPSFMWRSLLEGRDLLKQGLRFLIGNGKETSAWLDPWLPTHPPRPPRQRENVQHTVIQVGDLLNRSCNGWNHELLNQVIVAEDIPIISSLRLSSVSSVDMLGWHYTDSGIYTVKSGYWLASHLPHNDVQIQYPPGPHVLKTAIWKMKTAPKLKHFLWRVLSNALAVGDTLAYRGIIPDPVCRRCGLAVESMHHLFFQCSYAQDMWNGTSFPVDLLLSPTVAFYTKIRILVDIHNDNNLSSLSRHLPIWLMWRLWKSRNALIYQQCSSTWQHDLRKAIDDATEWLPAGSFLGSVNPQSARQSCVNWERPPTNFLKLNYDCHYNQVTASSAAWVIRDSHGVFRGAGHAIGNFCNSPLEAELQALLMVIQVAWSRGYDNIIFEGDNQSVPYLIDGRMKNFGLHNLIRDIRLWQSRFQNSLIQWRPRRTNRAADMLVKSPASSNISFLSYSYIPHCITHILHEDYIRSN